MKEVLVLGGTTYDHIVYLPELPRQMPHTLHQAGFHEGVGSTGAGKALALTRLGVSNTLLSAAGEDRFGLEIAQTLKRDGVDLILAPDPAGTERHINLMDPQGSRISMFVTQASEHIWLPEGLLERLIDSHKVLIINIIGYCRDWVQAVRDSGKPVWTDLHDYDGSSEYHQDFIRAAQYIHLSSDNLPDYRPVMEALIAAGKELVICTHGRAGATALTRAGHWYEQPAVPDMPVVDANGAGDSFFSGFLYGWLRHEPVETCLRYGALCGAMAVTDHALAWPGLSATWLKENI